MFTAGWVLFTAEGVLFTWTSCGRTWALLLHQVELHGELLQATCYDVGMATPKKTPPATQGPGPGRPRDTTSKKTTTVRLDQDLIDWINQNISRGTSLSAFVNEAVREKVTRLRRR